jgi:hypothetical protein
MLYLYYSGDVLDFSRRTGEKDDQQSSLREKMWKGEGSTCCVFERKLCQMSIGSSSMIRLGSS